MENLKPERSEAATPPESLVVELQQRIVELTAAVAARDSFIAVAAHELRNPMTPILGYVELLMSALKVGQLSPDRLKQGLERIRGSVRRYIRRAEVVLQVSRINRDSLHLDLEQFDLVGLLRDLAGDFTGATQRAGIPVTLCVPDSLEGTWDRVAMEQIIDNLMSNAIKYGGRTPVELSAAICGDNVRIQVRDYGCGILAENRERIFDRFERAVGLGEGTSGFGVGLWVVRQLASAMYGTVAIADAPGGGALFTVTLPRNVRGVCL